MKRWAGGLVAVTALVMMSAARVSAAPSDQDTSWMGAAHQSNLAEIAAGNVALNAASSQPVRNLAQMFVTMHTQLDADLTAAATQLGVALPDSPTAAQQQNLAAVQAQRGAAFDSAWLADQLAGHQAALQATQTEQQQGSDQVVVGLANKAEPVVAQHLSAVQAAISRMSAESPLATTGPRDLGALAATATTLVLAGLALVVLSRRRRAAA